MRRSKLRPWAISGAVIVLLASLPVPKGQPLAGRSRLDTATFAKPIFLAALTEEACDPGDIGAVNESVDRVRGNVMAGGRRRDCFAEGAGNDRDVRTV